MKKEGEISIVIYSILYSNYKIVGGEESLIDEYLLPYSETDDDL